MYQTVFIYILSLILKQIVNTVYTNTIVSVIEYMFHSHSIKIDLFEYL